MKQKVISYEIGGGRLNSNLLMAPLNPSNLSSIASICIVLDLSKPENCIDSLAFWLGEVRKLCVNSLKDLQNQSPEEFNSIRAKAESYWNRIPNQTDRNEIKVNFIPISVICNKYDIFAKQCEPKFKKILCSALRYFCHKYGADLVFSSLLEQIPMKIYKNLTSYYCFKDLVESSLQTGNAAEEMDLDKDPQAPL